MNKNQASTNNVEDSYKTQELKFEDDDDDDDDDNNNNIQTCARQTHLLLLDSTAL